MSASPAIVERFAWLVARHDGNAMLITEANAAERWVPIAEAAARRRAFAIEVAPDVLATDGDRPTAPAAVEALAQQLRLDGLRPVVLASGRPGHRHLFCRIGDRDLRRRYASRAKSAGLDVRSVIPPPLAPHRLGLAVELLDPADIEAALAALAPARGNVVLRLSERMSAVLRSGDHAAHGYRTRSDMIQGLALAFVNVEATEDEFVAALLDPANGGGEKLRGRSERSARTYLLACWAQAQARAEAAPAIADRSAALAEIARIRALALASHWSGRGGACDWAVMEAHFALASRAGKVAGYHADVRTLAELSGVTRSSVSRAHRRLRHAGWLRLQKGARRERRRANVWRLLIPSAARVSPSGTFRPCDASAEPLAPVTSRDIRTGGRGGDAESVPLGDVEAGDAGADVWRQAALGKAAFRVWQRLTVNSAHDVEELAQALHRKPAAIRKQLVRLAAWQLAVRDPVRAWLRGPADPEDVASLLGVAGERMSQHRRHDDERTTFTLGCEMRRALRGSETTGRRGHRGAP